MRESCRLSKALFNSRIIAPDHLDEATQRLYKGCFVWQTDSGIFCFSQLGLRILTKIENIIRKHMFDINCVEVKLPLLQNKQIWKNCNKEEAYGDETFKVVNRKGTQFYLSPTAEALCSAYVASFLNSYKQLPISIFQIGPKFRDELRYRGGLLRAAEFIMKDAYTFALNLEQAESLYVNFYNSYLKIFKELGLQIYVVEAATDNIGGKWSHEFVIASNLGDSYIYYGDNMEEATPIEKYNQLKTTISFDAIYPNSVRCIEVGHIFSIGDDIYTNHLGVQVQIPASVDKKTMWLSSYGIGVSRLLSVLALLKYWPQNISPFDIHLIAIDLTKSEAIFNLLSQSFEILYDDRDHAPGFKFHDAEIIGIPIWVVAGNFLEIHYKGQKFETTEDTIIDDLKIYINKE